MRRRIGLLATVAAVALLVGPSAGAASVNGFAGGEQFGFASWSNYSGCVYTFGGVAAYTDAGALATGTTVTPAAGQNAEAAFYTYDFCSWSFSGTYYPVQAIAPGAFVLDPIGNSARIRVCLTSGGPGCTPFDVTMTRPSFTYVASPNVQCPACYPPNVWLDAGAAHADTGFGNVTYIVRYGYIVSGTAGSSPISGFTFGYAYNILGAIASVDAP